MSIFNNFSRFLHNSAYLYKSFGWSIIPLVGSMNPVNGKSPALSTWRMYQSRIATDSEIDSWFLQHNYQAMGIVLGAVSGLVVLDIDDSQRAQAFASQCPDLTDTYTIRSGNRQLPHYYFQVPPELIVTSRCKAGVELRAEGQYVVAPNMEINGKRWTPINTHKPRMLTKRDLSRILAFIGVHSRPKNTKRENRQSEAIQTHSESQPQSTPYQLSPAGLIRRYEKLASEIGRNNALFKLTCFARDCGWSIERVQKTLTTPHINHPPMVNHPPETSSQRQREATATIASVFNCEPRSRPTRSRVPSNQLPNGVREKLLQLGFTNVARVLDGLLMAGYEAGRSLNPAEVYNSIGQYGIGRNTIYETLKVVVDGQTVFKPVVSPAPPSPNANAVRRFAEKTNQCLIARVAKSGKIRGRKKQHYLMPSIDALCEWFNVNVTIGDTLPESALASPKAYREALHVALIQRAPGQYSRQWQSERLGVSKDSLRRYEKARNVIVQAMYRAWQIGWHNLKNIMPDEPMDGHFVEDESGQRYPPIIALVRGLLTQGKRLLYKVQLTNFYAMPAMLNQSISHSQSTPKSPSPSPIKAVVSAVKSMLNVTTGDNSDSSQKLPTSQILTPSENSFSAHVETSPKCHHAPNVTTGDNSIASTVSMTTNAESLATRIYETLRNLNPDRAITRKNAQSLIEKYSVNLIERGLRVVKAKRGLRNPTGFLMTWLRAQNLELNGSQKTSSPHPIQSTKNDSHEAWLNRLKESPYLKFIENADQVFDT